MYYNPAERGLIKGVRMSDINYGRCANCMIHGRGCWWPTESLTTTSPTDAAAAATAGLTTSSGESLAPPEWGHVVDEETHAKRSKRIEKRRNAQDLPPQPPPQEEKKKKPCRRNNKAREDHPSTPETVLPGRAETKPPIPHVSPVRARPAYRPAGPNAGPSSLGSLMEPMDVDAPLDLNRPAEEVVAPEEAMTDRVVQTEDHVELDHSAERLVPDVEPDTGPRSISPRLAPPSPSPPPPPPPQQQQQRQQPTTTGTDLSAETNAALVRALMFMQQDDEEEEDVQLGVFHIAADEVDGDPPAMAEAKPLVGEASAEEPTRAGEEEEATMTMRLHVAAGIPNVSESTNLVAEVHQGHVQERATEVQPTQETLAQEIAPQPTVERDGSVIPDASVPTEDPLAQPSIEDQYHFLMQSGDEGGAAGKDDVEQGGAMEVDVEEGNVDEETAMNEYGGELEGGQDEENEQEHKHEQEHEQEQEAVSAGVDEVPDTVGESVSVAEKAEDVPEQDAKPSQLDLRDQGENGIDIEAKPVEHVQAVAVRDLAPEPVEHTQNHTRQPVEDAAPEIALEVAQDNAQADIQEPVVEPLHAPPTDTPREAQPIVETARIRSAEPEPYALVDSVPETQRDLVLQVTDGAVVEAPPNADTLKGGDETDPIMLGETPAPAAVPLSGRTRPARSTRAKSSINRNRKTRIPSDRSAVDPATYRLTQKWIDRLAELPKVDIVVVPTSVPLRYDNTNLMSLDLPGVNKVFRKCTGCTLRECDCAPLPVDEEQANTEHAQYRQNTVLDTAGCLTCRICGVRCSFTLDPPIYGEFATLPSPRALDNMRLLPEDWDTRSELDGFDGREEDEADGENRDRDPTHADPTFLQSNRCSGCILRKSLCIALPAGEGRGGGCVKCQECNVACSFGVATPQADGKTIVWADADSTKAGGRAPPPEPKRATNYTTSKRRVLVAASDDEMEVDE